MIVAYRLLGEEDSSVAVVLGKAQQHGEGSAFERLREALDNLSRDEIGAPILINKGTSEAPSSYKAQELSTPLTVSKSVVAGSDSSSNSSGSGSSGSRSDDEGDDNEGSDEGSDESSDEGEEGEGDDNEGSDESSDEGEEGEGDDNEGSDESSDEGEEGEGDDGATISTSARAEG